MHLYDISTDEFRDVTQADIDRLSRCVATFGILVRHLRQSQRADDQLRAQIAVDTAQGKNSIGVGDERMRLLGGLADAT